MCAYIVESYEHQNDQYNYLQLSTSILCKAMGLVFSLLSSYLTNAFCRILTDIFQFPSDSSRCGFMVVSVMTSLWLNNNMVTKLIAEVLYCSSSCVMVCNQ